MSESTFISRFFEILVRRIAAGLKIPEPALRMFRTANELSGLDRRTLPTELIPLNTIQISRGLLNFTLLQSLHGWVFPYWAERQYDPSDAGFIPRSHLGLSMNVTRRNWTAVGSPSCWDEPVVDPRGAVMPWRNGWTWECWLRHADITLFPSRASGVRQELLNGLPIVTTHFESGAIRMDQTVYVDGTTLIQESSIVNTGGRPETCALAYAIRPFNAEGACLLRDIRFDRSASAFIMGGTEHFMLPGPPDDVHCSNHAGGDSAVLFASGGRTDHPAAESVCRAGLANGYAAYRFTLVAGGSRTFRTALPLGARASLSGDIRKTESAWNALLETGTEILTPDRDLNMMVRASVCTLLMLTDGDSITPGPWTYHQFWFRDAALMLRALDVFGFHAETREVIRSFPSRQEPSGYFRSQKGEWDSNGQAIWTVWQHALLSGENPFTPEMAGALEKGAVWIARKRRETTIPGARDGLMPKGLSAEHLGLADRYFWDNWWSAAGLDAYARLCRIAGLTSALERTLRELREYSEDIEKAVSGVLERKGIDVIPAGPSRGIDCGMIGSCAPWYPLQIYPPGDARMRRTIETLSEDHILQGLFFQEFIHSGKNPYLTLQIAQAWLYAGNRERFWNMFTAVVRHASPTLNYPEAIHPLTGGGTMGDGHHGWAAAEVALAMRSAFVREVWRPECGAPVLVLLGGIPPSWFLPGRSFSIRRAPVPGGILTIETAAGDEGLSVEIEYEKKSEWGAREWTLEIPVPGSRITVNGSAAPSVALADGETTLTLRAEVGRTVVLLERHAETAAAHGPNL
jgi:hypothetical protein